MKTIIEKSILLFKLWKHLQLKLFQFIGANPLINLDFNKKSSINLHNFSSLKDVVDELKDIDSNPMLSERHINGPAFKRVKIIDKELVLEFFDNIFKNKDEIIKNKIYFGRWYHNHITELKLL